MERIFALITGLGLIFFIVYQIKNTSRSMYNHLSKKYDTLISKIAIQGRDEFYVDLIMQEHPMWFHQIADGKLIEQSEIDWLINRRGFNESESKSFQSLADFMNTNHELIKQIKRLTPESK